MSSDPAFGTVGAILMYHRVVADSPAGPIAVSSHRFREQMQWLRTSGLTIGTLEEIARTVSERCSTVAASLAVTIDDGYADGLMSAAPILNSCSVSATVFVVNDAVADGYEFWWDALDRVFDGRSHPNRLVVASARLDLPTSDPRERSAAHAQLRELCYRLPSRERDELVASVVEWSGMPSAPPHAARPLTSSELRTLASLPGIDIGAHSLSHVRLPAQTADVQAVEIIESKRQLEGMLGTPVTSFSYPYGAFDAVTQKLVRQAGFTRAVTVDPRPVAGSDSVFALPRYEIGDWDQTEFAHFVAAIFGNGGAGTTSVRAADTDAVSPWQ